MSDFTPFIPFVVFAAIVVAGLFLFRRRPGSGGSGSNGGSKGRPGADKH